MSVELDIVSVAVNDVVSVGLEVFAGVMLIDVPPMDHHEAAYIVDMALRPKGDILVYPP